MSFIMPQKSIVTAQGIKPIAEKREFKFDDRKAHAAEVFAKIGNLEDLSINYGQVLAAVYIRTEVGTGLLEAPPSLQMEDKWQGKCGLVLKTGPLAFKSEPGRDFGGASVRKGDWVLFRYSDGLNLDLRCLDGMNVIHCKLIQDVEVLGTVVSPDRVW